ncbi:unnamed protein product [Thelazia callipaeda]|uniref:Ground-like domain-containing protein n=1 Tax=Thelazia callipaeda TaxID=103827 RepID=A0A0N5DA39_THECL|nr:unnamed protein product [Thelazia callipaeda]
MLRYLTLAVILFLRDSSVSACSCCPFRCPPPSPCPSLICPQKVCPPPTACPVVVHQPCPPCPKPKPIPMSVIAIPLRLKPVVVNTCCATCPIPCTVRHKRDASDNKTVELSNPICNNKMLHDTITKQMTFDPVISQQQIVKALIKFDQYYNVICASGELSYAAYTNDFCQVVKDGIACYAFKQL